jgi:hypothetical protein
MASACTPTSTQTHAGSTTQTRPHAQTHATPTPMHPSLSKCRPRLRAPEGPAREGAPVLAVPLATENVLRGSGAHSKHTHACTPGARARSVGGGALGASARASAAAAGFGAAQLGHRRDTDLQAAEPLLVLQRDRQPVQVPALEALRAAAPPGARAPALDRHLEPLGASGRAGNPRPSAAGALSLRHARWGRWGDDLAAAAARKMDADVRIVPIVPCAVRAAGKSARRVSPPARRAARARGGRQDWCIAQRSLRLKGRVGNPSCGRRLLISRRAFRLAAACHGRST